MLTDHVTVNELIKGFEKVKASPTHIGTIDLIVRRPAVDEREIVQSAQLDVEKGLVGDNWNSRENWSIEHGLDHNLMQITLINSAAIAMLSSSKTEWPLAGDQLYVSLNLSQQNMPAGTKLQLGSALIEVTSIPHTACKKFAERYGRAALQFFNTENGRLYNLRGVNSRIIQGGGVAVGDAIKKLDD